MKIVKDTYNSGSLTELANDDTDDIEDVTYLTYSINNFIHPFWPENELLGLSCMSDCHYVRRIKGR